MTPKNERPHAIAREVLSDRAMDQALSWLIELEAPTMRSCPVFRHG